MALSAEASGRLADLLTEHAEQIMQRWTEVVAASLRGRLSQAELRSQVRDLHRGMVAAGEGGVIDLESEQATELRAVLAELSRGRARQGFSATETAISIYALKDVLLELLESLPDDEGTHLRDFVAYSALIDKMGLFTFESYVRTRESLIADQAEQLLELSTPVVKLWEGVVAVPLVGTLDSARAQVVMERLLQTLVDTSSPYAIIDITGVPAVDTQVAQHILKTVVAARLMGADCIISGIRPQIAQTIVALGIEFGDIATKATLADALRHVLRLSGVETALANRRARREV
ncbi:rsbT co-antagonist protein RsbR [Micromonospora pallida]|uniref:RsbT co-antagonist protein RsbR n=1 Tax=Micromonospora pallida TaxID=145854 RepID=A0A1C6T7W5_9ACTN|nr:STAS domain-containing protein [Micromonospora pallida]SCL37910.1 rsbT co-antagonist protein RsbR [Micromonospora pallida]